MTTTAAGLVLFVPAADDAIGGQAKCGQLLYDHVRRHRQTRLVRIALRSKLSGWRRILQRPLLYRELVGALWDPQLPILHIFSPCSRAAFYEKAALALLGKTLRKRVVLNFRNDYRFLYRKLSAPERQIHHKVFHAVDRVVCQSRDMADFIAQTYQLPERRVQHIYNCLEPQELEIALAHPIERGETAPLRVLFLGHVSHSKGTDTLVRVARVLRDRGVSCVFDVCGFASGPKHFHAVQAAITAHQLQERVLLRGVVLGEEKEAFFREASVFFLPSRTKGFSNAILEAMARGLPVVATPVGANEEMPRQQNLWVDSGSGSLPRL